jgi:hypothetical protein
LHHDGLFDYTQNVVHPGLVHTIDPCGNNMPAHQGLEGAFSPPLVMQIPSAFGKTTLQGLTVRKPLQSIQELAP